MSNVYYGKIDSDHYGFDLTPDRMGDNYVEITSEEHFRLIDSGKKITTCFYSLWWSCKRKCNTFKN